MQQWVNSILVIFSDWLLLKILLIKFIIAFHGKFDQQVSSVSTGTWLNLQLFEPRYSIQ